MAYKTKISLTTDTTIVLGGVNKETGDKNAASIEGYYLGNRPTPDKGYGPGVLHFFKTVKGVVGVWGKTRLNNLLTKELAGQMCLVTFTGMGPKSKGRSPAFLYEVKHDEDNTMDVSNLEVQDAAGEPAEDEDEDTGRSAPNYAADDEENDEASYEAAPAPVRTAAAPKRTASVPDAARQAQVQALLNKRSSKMS